MIVFYKKFASLFLSYIKSANYRRYNWIFLRNDLRCLFSLLLQDIITELNYAALFLFSALFAIIGVVIYFSTITNWSFAEIFALFALLLLLYYFFRQNKILPNIISLLFCLVLGLFCAKIDDYRHDTQMLERDLCCYVTGQLASFPEIKGNYYRFLLYIENNKKYNLPRLILASSREIGKNWQLGDYISGNISLYHLTGPARLDSYDFAFHNYFNYIGARGYFYKCPKYIGPSCVKQNILSKINNKILQLRRYINSRIKAKAASEEASIAIAIITGERSNIPEYISDALRRSGLSHILAISGLHMSMVAGLVFLVLRYILCLLEKIHLYLPYKKISALIALFSALFYFLLSGGSASAQRSFIMVAIIFIAIIFDKRAITMRNLAIALWINIIISPHEILEPSFQMSFAAAAALIAFFRNYEYSSGKKINISNELLDSLFCRILNFILLIFQNLKLTAISSLVAGTASTIYSFYHFGNYAPFSVISNVLASGVVSILIMPFALITVLLLPLNCEDFAIKILSFGIILLKKIAIYVADLTPNLELKYLDSTSLFIISMGFCLLVILRTRLKYLGLFIILFGLLFYYEQPLPIAIISENGKLIMALKPDHRAAINHASNNKFVLKIWQKSFVIDDILLPNKAEDAFIEDKKLSHISLANKAEFFIVKNEDGLRDALDNPAEHKIIFIDDKYNILIKNLHFYNSKHNLIITSNDVSLFGVAQIYDNNKIKWTINNPLRSWNKYRRFNIFNF